LRNIIVLWGQKVDHMYKYTVYNIEETHIM